MNVGLDDYAYLDSPIHRWEPRSKLIGLGMLIFAFAFTEELRSLPAILGIAIALYGLSNLPFSFLRSRLRYPGLLLLAIVVLLPLFSGETVIWQIGPIPLYKEGCLAAVLIASRFMAIAIASLVLFGTSPFLSLVRAMRSLGLSPILADMILLSYRYLFELGHQLNQMKMAAQLRGFQTRRLNRKNLEIFAALTGSLLMLSYEQSERVYKAMLLRGYGNEIMIPRCSSVNGQWVDWWSAIALTLSCTIAIALVVRESWF